MLWIFEEEHHLLEKFFARISVFNNQAGRSVEWPNAPTSKGAVRAENGPTGTVVKPLPGGKYLFLKFCIKINLKYEVGHMRKDGFHISIKL